MYMSTDLRFDLESLELCESTEAERCLGAGGGRVALGETAYRPRRAGADRVERGDPPPPPPPAHVTSYPKPSPLILRYENM